MVIKSVKDNVINIEPIRLDCVDEDIDRIDMNIFNDKDIHWEFGMDCIKITEEGNTSSQSQQTNSNIIINVRCRYENKKLIFESLENSDPSNIQTKEVPIEEVLDDFIENLTPVNNELAQNRIILNTVKDMLNFYYDNALENNMLTNREYNVNTFVYDSRDNLLGIANRFVLGKNNTLLLCELCIVNEGIVDKHYKIKFVLGDKLFEFNGLCVLNEAGNDNIKYKKYKLPKNVYVYKKYNPAIDNLDIKTNKVVFSNVLDLNKIDNKISIVTPTVNDGTYSSIDKLFDLLIEKNNLSDIDKAVKEIRLANFVSININKYIIT